MLRSCPAFLFFWAHAQFFIFLVSGKFRIMTCFSFVHAIVFQYKPALRSWAGIIMHDTFLQPLVLAKSFVYCDFSPYTGCHACFLIYALCVPMKAEAVRSSGTAGLLRFAKTCIASMQVVELHSRHGLCESPLRADNHSSIGFGGSALGGHAMSGMHRHSSFASSDAFAGLQSIGSVAGSDDEPPRVALPPLSTLPRISREGLPLLTHVITTCAIMMIRKPCFLFLKGAGAGQV
jgi:hypothetical protein